MRRPEPTSSGPRRAALVAIAVGAVVFVLVTVWKVPWDPVPGGTPPPVPATSVFSSAYLHRADTFAWWARILSWSSLAVTVVFACLVGFTRWGSRLVGRLPGPWWCRVLLASSALQLGDLLVTLPFSVVLQHRFRHYGLSTEGWGAWALDVAKAEAVTLVTVGIGLVALVGCARRLPRAWPAVAGVLLAGLVMGGSFVYPLVVQPLYNHFTPLPDGPLRTQILRLAKVEGVHVDDVQVVDASRQTTTLNAYVSGYGSTRRVVVYDNLVDGPQALDQREVLSVVGHELGHAKNDDVLTGSLLGAAAALMAVGLLALLIGGGSGGGSAGRPGVGDPRSVPRMLALVVVAMLVVSPVENGISRRIETRADVDSLRYYGDPQAFIALQKQLAERSLQDPSPPALSQFWFGTHPTPLTRIAIAEKLAARGDG